MWKFLTAIADAFRSQDRPIKHIVDPVFGKMWLNANGVWRASIEFPGRDPEIALYIRDAEENGPTLWQQNLFTELVARYEGLKREMDIPLWTEYEYIRKTWELACPAITEPEGIWSVAHLIAIEISGEHSACSVDLSLDHQIDWENEDHNLNVFIKEWRILEVAMEG